MKIRKVKSYSKRVLNALQMIMPQLDPDSELPDEEKFRSILKSKAIHFFIAEFSNKEIAGMLTLVEYKILTGTKMWIEDVVVDEAFRGKGIGKELMINAIEFAKNMGAKSVDLTSRPSRITANKLYQDIGFALRETNVYRYTLK